MTFKTVFHREYQIRFCFQRIKFPQFQTLHFSTYISTYHKADFKKEPMGNQKVNPTQKETKRKQTSTVFLEKGVSSSNTGKPKSVVSALRRMESDSLQEKNQTFDAISSQLVWSHHHDGANALKAGGWRRCSFR